MDRRFHALVSDVYTAVQTDIEFCADMDTELVWNPFRTYNRTVFTADSTLWDGALHHSDIHRCDLLLLHFHCSRDRRGIDSRWRVRFMTDRIVRLRSRPLRTIEHIMYQDKLNTQIARE